MIRTQILDVGIWARTAFDGLMTIYGSCQRAAFKQQLINVRLTELRGRLAHRYPELDAQYRNDAINQGQATITSQRKLLPRRLSEVEAKISRKAGVDEGFSTATGHHGPAR